MSLQSFIQPRQLLALQCAGAGYSDKGGLMDGPWQ